MRTQERREEGRPDRAGGPGAAEPSAGEAASPALGNWAFAAAVARAPAQPSSPAPPSGGAGVVAADALSIAAALGNQAFSAAVAGYGAPAAPTEPQPAGAYPDGGLGAVLARQGTGVADPPRDAGADLPGGVPASSGLATPGCDISLPDVVLFDRIERTWPLFGMSQQIPIWHGTADLGWLGYIEFDVVGELGAEANLLAGIGAGELREICLNGDPAAGGAYSGSARLYVPSELAPDLKLTGGLRGSADYLGSIPVLALQGTLESTGDATLSGLVNEGVTVTYADGKLSFSFDHDLSFGALLRFSLDATLLAELLGETVWQGNWNLVNWEWGREWPILGRLAVRMSDGVAGTPEVEFHADSISLDDVLEELFRDLIDPQEIIGGATAARAATEVPMLDPTATMIANAAIAAEEYEIALDIVVRSLPIDTSLCTIAYVVDDSQGDGLTTTNFQQDPDTGQYMPTGPSTVSIYTPGFKNLPWLVSTVMHEYQHVLQHQRGLSPAEFESEAEGEQGDAARETEAYLWEIENAHETGLLERFEDLREVARRLTDHFEQLAPTRREQYRERYDAAQELVDEVVGLQAPDLPPYENVFHHGTDYDTAEALADADLAAIGGNDFGRGFYTHTRENWELAKEWAIRVSRSKGAKGWGVVTFPVPDEIWEEEITEQLIFLHPRDQPENIPINPDTGEKFADWAEFVRYNKRFRRDRLPEWTEVQIIIGPLWGRYENDPKVRQAVFTTPGLPVLNRRDVKQLRIVFVRRFRGRNP